LGSSAALTRRRSGRGSALAGGPILLAACLLPGCSSPTEPTVDDRDQTRQALRNAQALWASRRITDYTYTYRRLCFCPVTGPARVTVRGGSPVEAGRPRIEDLFEEIETALDRGANEIRATYDPTFGYPTHYYIDLDARTVDEEQTVEASDLQRS
jgi:hypothetical protein